jgi:hypothetical protein
MASDGCSSVQTSICVIWGGLIAASQHISGDLDLKGPLAVLGRQTCSGWCVLSYKERKTVAQSALRRPEREAYRSPQFVPRLRMGAAIPILPHTTS